MMNELIVLHLDNFINGDSLAFRSEEERQQLEHDLTEFIEEQSEFCGDREFPHLTLEEMLQFIQHCRAYKIAPVIVDFYESMDDYFDEWIPSSDTTEEEALERLAEGKECGEIFCLDNGIMLQLDLSAC